MPEGDTIHKLANAIASGLCGQRADSVRVRACFGAALAGSRILDVSSKGKHLFVAFDNGLVLRSHLGMFGSWHRYRVGEPWRKPARQASVEIEAAGQVYVCFNAREVEVMSATGHRLLDARRRLGPDLIRQRPDGALLADRARDLVAPGASLADMLLDQRLASGIGNVYKCEVLFLEGQHPLKTLADTPPATLESLYRLAGELLRRNLGAGPRVTRFVADARGDLWVYGRADRPCLRCGAAIRREPTGMAARSTYWCPSCQPL